MVLATIGAAFMSSLDLFVVNVAFDDIGRDLGVGTSGGPTAADLSWVLSAYAVVYAALLVPFGRLADRYGRKRLFIAGLIVFVAASAACAVSADVWSLVGFRAAQAAGAAAMTPASLGILMAALPPEKRVGAVRLWAATGALAAAFGPTVGGVLTQVSWHWVFLINIPVGAVLLWLAVTAVDEAAADSDAPRPDLVGASLFAGAVGLLALGLTKSNDWGWTSGRTAGAFAAAAALAAAFVWQSRRHVSPVIHPALLRVRTFRYTNLAMLTFNIAFAARLLVGILWLQQIWGYSALRTGFAIAAGPALVPVTAVLTHRLLPSMSAARLVAIGSVLCALGNIWLVARMGNSPEYLTSYLPGWLLSGIGVGFALPNLMAGATHDLRPDQSATGSAIVTMSRQIGFVIGVSVLFAIIGSDQGLAAMDGFVATWWFSVAALLVAAVVAAGMSPRAATPAAGGQRVMR
ncbi:MFS transporter [Aeromicrobium sp. UC242_57]|uniref:MFS transporter n=1 Tax=Aeromicrobium sp. UC242_57 TaxID=3374624 RepID=UPI0037AB6ABC